MSTSQAARHAIERAVATVALLAGIAPVAAQTGDTLRRVVEETLRDERDTRGLTVTVAGGEVTLAGRVETFWVKHQALRRTFEVSGVDTVVSELEIPAVESDQALAEEIGRVVQRYAFYTLWDYIGAVIDRGEVRLTGWVTPDRDKADDIFERVAKVRGVQAIDNAIVTLPPGEQDRRLRRAIGRRLFASPNFERFATMSNPPFRIIVANSIVTLLGYVQTDIERIDMAVIVSQTEGVVRVDNRIETLR